MPVAAELLDVARAADGHLECVQDNEADPTFHHFGSWQGHDRKHWHGKERNALSRHRVREELITNQRGREKEEKMDMCTL